MSFPIAPLIPELVATLATSTRLVLEAPPGAGKTTQVPPALAAAPWLEGRVVMLEPRRIAARAAAEFIAKRYGEPVGATVGYRIRGETRVSAATRIEVVTEAILTRMLQDDPLLDGIGAVVFDEFHERNLHSDLGLALALDAQREVRPDLRLVVMSATLEGDRLATFLDAPRLASAGRAFPVEIAHLAPRKDEPWQGHARRAVEAALDACDGDVLVFLPGKREIARLEAALAEPLAARRVDALPLHGELSIDAQRAVLAPPPAGTRKVVLATNVAESSVTLPAVRAVVDTGLAREPRFDPASGLSRLETVAISQASAAQRAGRAGRTAPGRAYRLWPESMRLAPAIRPEIHNVELSPLALELAAWGASSLRFLDAPPPGPLAEARERLASLGALDADGRITAHGRQLIALGTHPRLAHAILAAPRALAAFACDVAALIEARDPLRGEARRSDDLRTRLAALAQFRARATGRGDVERATLVEIDRQARELVRRARIAPSANAASALDAGRVLALAYPDRIARQLAADPRRYQLANGRGARLADDSALYGEAWLVASELVFDEREARITRGAPVDEAFLREHYAARFSAKTEVSFERDSRGLVAHEVQRFGALVLARRPVPPPRDDAATSALVDGVRALGLAALPWTEPLRQWRERVVSLRAWLPDLGLPDLGDDALAATLDAWLAPYLAGKARLGELDAATLGEALATQLDHAQRRALDEHAPVALTVPSGQTRRLEYAGGAPPVLAVKLQELFGLADTPRIARGRVAVTLHLLSPAQRPIQVTQDLRGFWERTYPEVRKELKGRYPRHPWPDDPWHAEPTHRAKRRGT